MRKGLVSPATALLPLRLFLGLTFVYAGSRSSAIPGSCTPARRPTSAPSSKASPAARRAASSSRPSRSRSRSRRGSASRWPRSRSACSPRAASIRGSPRPAGWGSTSCSSSPRAGTRLPTSSGPTSSSSSPGFPSCSPAPRASRRSTTSSTDRRWCSARVCGSPTRTSLTASDPGSTRRTLLLELGAAAAAIGGISLLAKGAYSAPRSFARGSSAGSGRGGGGKPAAQGGGEAGRTGSGGGASKVPSNAVELGPAGRLPSGTAATYSDPTDGAPDIVIRESGGGIRAFSAVCTHAGCTVGYESGTIVCPCHGGEYSAETGEVIAGPPPAPLEPRKVLEANGKIYALPS